IVPFQSADEGFKRLKPKAVILSGGPASTTEMGSPSAPELVFDSGLPVLGICYGQQTMCAQLGGKVEGGHHREFGRAFVEISKPSALFEGVWNPGESHQVWMSHGDRVTELPQGFEVIAASPNAPYAATADEARRYYAVQFHPDVLHTPDGAKLISNFVHKIAGLKGDWTMAAYKEQAIAAIREQV
ncbi:MAG: glutamine-hydrolyzing GMP synthase, partial [Candidatus Competibacteraceae bacterium]|nr:glutamine-hydrolyzing GMP synthase [Candidatus Competibacteraceae bacterium]